MVLAQKWTTRSIGQNRKPRNKPATIWSFDLLQSRKEHPVGKEQALQGELGKLDSTMQKNETGPLSTPFTKINSKCMEDLNVKP